MSKDFSYILQVIFCISFGKKRLKRYYREHILIIPTPVKLFNITDIFNNIITMSPETLEAFHDELQDNYKVLAKAGDIDNLRVLRNRLQTILDANIAKLSKREHRKLEKLAKLLIEIDETIEAVELSTREEIILVDVISKYKKKHKSLDTLPVDKKKTHVLNAVRKDEISYEEEMIGLQIELVKLQRYIQESGKKVLIIFEGRDAAGK
jgi:Polyphosphate kinase 2 (PPK2)